MNKIILILPMYIIAINSFAASVLPPVVGDRITITATMKIDPVKTIKLGGNIFKFEETSLSEIKETIGFGEIMHAGDAASSQYWLCYSQQNQTIWFISHGEMGGPSNVLTQVQAVSENLGCPDLKYNYKITSSFGWLGMSKNALKKLLGDPSGISGNTLKYFYLGKKKGEYKGKIINWDVTGYIEATTKNNKINSIYASHTTTN